MSISPKLHLENIISTHCQQFDINQLVNSEISSIHVICTIYTKSVENLIYILDTINS